MTYDAKGNHICEECGTTGLANIYDKCFNCFAGITKRRAAVEKRGPINSSSTSGAGQSDGQTSSTLSGNGLPSFQK